MFQLFVDFINVIVLAILFKKKNPTFHISACWKALFT